MSPNEEWDRLEAELIREHATGSVRPARDLNYRRWIASLPCAVCGRRQCDPHHTGPHGIGQKASDYSCIPLCRIHHDWYHKIGRVRFEMITGKAVVEMVKGFNETWVAMGREVYDNGEARRWRCPECKWWREWADIRCVACGARRDGDGA